MKNRKIKFNIIFRSISCVFLFTFVYLVFRCTSYKEYNQIYQEKREWTFDIHNFDSNNLLTDSCVLKLIVNNPDFSSLLFGEKRISYQYKDCPNGELFFEQAKLKEGENGITLYPPSLRMFYFTDMLPFPFISFPPETEVNLSTSRKIHTSDSLELDVVELYSERNKIDSLVFHNEWITCFFIEGRNINYIEELGQYRCEYWFNIEYGFIRFLYYKPNGCKTDIMLKEVNF